MKENADIVYNRAKAWQIGLFTFNNAATNLCFFLMMYYAFYSQNVLGLSAAIVGTISMFMRIFDGFTDPIIGYLMDKTDGRFGKFRPFMLVGNIIIVTSVFLVFRTESSWEVQAKYIYTTAVYFIFVIGYTLQCTVTKGAQAALTNDPSQRPLFTLFDTILTLSVFNGGSYILFTVLGPKYPQSINDPAFWLDASLIFALVSFAMTILAIIGIWEKDRTEYFGLGNKAVKIKFKDTVDVIKKNRPLQLLIVAACTDKIALTAVRTGLVFFFSNLLLNSSLQGKYAMWAMFPGVLSTYFGVSLAKKMGIKKSFVTFTKIGTILLLTLMVAMPLLVSDELNGGVMILLALLAIQTGVSQLAGSIVIPMIADCSDYETYRTGKFMPGLLGTLFSFVDKLVSSTATFIIGIAISLAGYGSVKIQPNTAVGPKMQLAIIFILLGLPLIGHLASLVAMKYYDLDAEKMMVVKRGIQERKAKVETEREELRTAAEAL